MIWFFSLSFFYLIVIIIIFQTIKKCNEKKQVKLEIIDPSNKIITEKRFRQKKLPKRRAEHKFDTVVIKKVAVFPFTNYKKILEFNMRTFLWLWNSFGDYLFFYGTLKIYISHEPISNINFPELLWMIA